MTIELYKTLILCLAFQHLYPKTQIDVFVTVLENDGSVLAAAMTCASLALANASVQMFDITIGASLVSRVNRFSFKKKQFGLYVNIFPPFYRNE